MATIPAKFGPAVLVAAAFIGPGTITTASIAGAGYGFALCWTLVFSVLATFVLQEMSARLGIVTGRGLSENLRDFFAGSRFGPLASALVIVAIGFGNAAYESGNILGASLGLQAILGLKVSIWALLVAVLAGALLAAGQYRLIEAAMIALVLAMSAVFLLTVVMVRPPVTAIISGLLVPSLPTGSILTVLALIGTTVVPYNLFLHASAAANKWAGDGDSQSALAQSRWDTGLSIGVGGLITLAVMCTSAVAFFGSDSELSAASLALQLEPLLGNYARYFFALGLFAAGLSSAITAPLAAAYAVCGVVGWPNDLKHPGFRLVWLSVLVCGTLFAGTGVKPLTAILFAQAANGFLLPFCAIFLLAVMNRARILGSYRNRAIGNAIGSAIVLVILGLSALKIAQLLKLTV